MSRPWSHDCRRGCNILQWLEMLFSRGPQNPGYEPVLVHCLLGTGPHKCWASEQSFICTCMGSRLCIKPSPPHALEDNFSSKTGPWYQKNWGHCFTGPFLLNESNAPVLEKAWNFALFLSIGFGKHICNCLVGETCMNLILLPYV